MFSRFTERVGKTVGFRLTLWYSALFALSSLILSGLIYVLLLSYMEKKEREAIGAKMEKYATIYLTEGIEALKKDVRLEKSVDRHNCFLVRVAGRDNGTLFVSLPDRDGDHAQEFPCMCGGPLPAPGAQASRESPDPLSRHAQNLNLKPNHWVAMEVEDGENGFVEMACAQLADGTLLQVGRSTENREKLMESVRSAFAAVLGPMVLLSFLGGAFLSFRFLRPIRNIVRTVRSIDVSRMTDRVERGGARDELDDLVVLFNEMLEKIEFLIHGMRDALDNVAHDLRTPLMRLKGTAELALEHPEENCGTLREALMDCSEESERIITILSTLMDISEAETGMMKLRMEKGDLAGLVRGVAELYGYVAEERSIEIRLALPGVLPFSADMNRMRQVVANLLDNAVKYTPEGGEVTIEVGRETGRVVLIVADTGEGIPPDELSRIWERLYRVDRSRSRCGLGLGLSMVRAVVHAHNGRVEVASRPGIGSRFTVYLPDAGSPP